MGETLGVYIGIGLFLSLILAVVLNFVENTSSESKEKGQNKKASQFKCIDGHIVKSRGELIIDNHLTRLNITHEYENLIIVNENPMKYDWYLPDFDVYIEYWGFFGKDYMQRKEEKLQIYSEANLNLISIEDFMLEDIYSYLEALLSEYGFYPTYNENKVKFCPSCGTKLDERIIKHY